MTLQQRLEWIRDTKFGGSARKMSLGCGLSHSHVTAILRKLRSHSRAAIEIDTLAKIAEGAKIRVDWLLNGAGIRDIDPEYASSLGHSVDYPERDKAVQAALALEICQEAIDRVVSYTYPDTVDAARLTRMDWLRRMEDADNDIKSVPCRMQSDTRSRIQALCGGSKPAL